MRKNVIWIFLLIVMALLALWFVVRAGYSVYSYYKLSAEAPAQVELLSIEEINPNSYLLIAKFYFNYQGQEIHGRGAVGHPYPNSWSAERAQTNLAKKTWTIWFDPAKPDHFVLEKKFPYKRAISAGVLIVLLAYFAILGLYVTARKS